MFSLPCHWALSGGGDGAALMKLNFKCILRTELRRDVIFFFPAGISSPGTEGRAMLWVGRVGGGKAAFSQILPSLTIHVLSECCRYPLAPGLALKSMLIWQEMESCPGVQQRDPL